MELINDLQRFAGSSVEISIKDEQGGDQAAIVKKTLKKVQLCPDQTHVRFYFDDFYFLAVPLGSDVVETETTWSAFEKTSGLTYNIKKVQVL
ncbi:hypothetical protein ABES02_12730 [Neobacillus pocheonensis]|uniref:hypothetical protein n=1 Tax=Neobacillus pocheonensis TaxID=363869 RepID=UPI003D28927A